MNIKESEFFQQVTIRICRQLQIEKAMVEFVKYIRNFIPVDVMYFELMFSDLGVLKINARTTAKAGSKKKICPAITF
jgi:hypothetical protein